jgi:hypothetical protein
MTHFDEGITSISKGLGDAAKGVAPHLTGVDVQDESLTGADIDNASLKARTSRTKRPAGSMRFPRS